MGRGRGGKRLKRGEDLEETIKEKCKHSIQISDKRDKTFHLPVLNSPRSFSAILRRHSVAKQPEPCRNCVRETEREKHA